MALPNLNSASHLASALSFASEILAHAPTFFLFYGFARKKLFLEGLNFFLEVSNRRSAFVQLTRQTEYYRFLPLNERILLEKEIMAVFAATLHSFNSRCRGICKEIHRKR